MLRLQAGMSTLLPDVRSRNETGKWDPTLTRNLRAEETNARHDIPSGEIFTHHPTLPTLINNKRSTTNSISSYNLMFEGYRLA